MAALTVYRSQLIFSGVRRRPNFRSDPGPSTYKYYEKEYSIPFTEAGAATPGLAINNYASTGGVLNPAVQTDRADSGFRLRATPD